METFFELEFIFPFCLLYTIELLDKFLLGSIHQTKKSKTIVHLIFCLLE